MKRRPLPAVATLALLLLARCDGAVGTPAPLEPEPAPRCGSAEELAPTLRDLALGPEASSFGALVTRLQEPIGVDQRVPLTELLRSVLAVLREYGTDPNEAGGAPCAGTPPPPGEYHNRTCQLQRLLDPSRGDGAGLQVEAIAALGELKPLIGNLLAYMTGAAPLSSAAYDEDGDGDASHYALVDVIHATCQEDALCGVGNTLELLVAAVDTLAQPLPGAGGCEAPGTVGERLFCAMEAFVLDPSFADWWSHFDFVNPELNERGQPKGRAGFFALLGLFLEAIDRAGVDPEGALEDLVAQLATIRLTVELAWSDTSLLPAWDAMARELTLLLHPDRGVLLPLQRVLACEQRADKRVRLEEEARIGRPLPEGLMLLVALHSLLFADPVNPVLSPQELVRQLGAVAKLDREGVVLGVIQDLLHALKAHEELFSEPQAPLPASCKLIFDREAAAELLPIVSRLLDSRLIEETVCILDVLLYGCAGGERPTICEPAAEPPL